TAKPGTRGNGYAGRRTRLRGAVRSTALKPRELVRRSNQCVEIARFVEQMPGVGDDVELDLGPCLRQPPGGDRRRAGVVAALDDHAGDSTHLAGAGEQLPFLQPAVVRHEVVLDPR